MEQFVKVCDDATSRASKKGRNARMLDVRISLLKDELDFLKQKVSTS